MSWGQKTYIGSMWIREKITENGSEFLRGWDHQNYLNVYTTYIHMKTSIVKTVKKYGNSGGVYLPNSWVGGKVRVELVEEAADPKKDVLSKIPLEHVVSAILYGSYARQEALEGSDIDLLLVTDEDARIDIPPEIKNKYDTQVMSISALRNAIAHDPIFYNVIKNEAVAIINHKFLDDIRKEPPKLTGIGSRLEFIESSLNITNNMMEAGIETTDLVYPLMMRLKEIVLLEYFLADKKYSTQSFKKEVISHDVSPKEFHSLMAVYRATRDGKKVPKYQISGDVIVKLISLLEMKIQHVRQKARKKRH